MFLLEMKTIIIFVAPYTISIPYLTHSALFDWKQIIIKKYWKIFQVRHSIYPESGFWLIKYDKSSYARQMEGKNKGDQDEMNHVLL